MQTKQLFTLVTVLVIVTNLVAPVWAQRDKKIQQSEKEFERLMPITGTVETSFGKFEVDHSFPTKETSERIYDLMDYSRAAQLYLWSLPITSLTQMRYLAKSFRRSN